MTTSPNNAQQTRPSGHCCNRRVSACRAVVLGEGKSLSWDR